MLSSKWLGYVRVAIVALTVALVTSGCASAPTEKTEERVAETVSAYTVSTTVYWTGGKTGTCAGVCGGDYACSSGGTGDWNGGLKSFTDPAPVGSPAPTSVTVNVYQAGCAAGAVTVSLNGTLLGSYNSTTTACGCGTCDATQSVTYNNANGVPGYVTGGMNTITIGTAANICVDRATISLTGADVAKLSPSPGTLAFGNQRVGTTSASQNVVVTNEGNATLTITSAGIAAPFSLTAAPSLPASVAPNASVTFSVAFTPAGTGNATGSLTFASNDPAGNKTVSLSGVGVAPSIGGAPNPLDFGNTALGASPTQNVTLSNPGLATLTVSGLAVQGANASDFTLVSPPPMPTTIAPNGTLVVPVRFSPGDHGARSAQLVVTSDAYQLPTYVISLSGSGVAPRMVVSPSSVVFGTTNVNVAAAPKTVTVQNTGETALQVTGATFSGANASDFSSSTSFPLNVAPNASASIVLGFKPTAVGARSATVTVTSNDPQNATAQLSLTGEAVSPAITVAPSKLDFGDVRAGSTSGAKSVTITNSGTGTLTVSALALGGQDPSHFKLAGLALPAQIAGGSSAAVNVTFAPTAVAASAATLTVVSNDASNPNVVVQLTGNGVSPSIALNPTTLDFGGQVVGRASQPRSADVHNTGTAPLRITTLTLSGTDAAAFAQVNAPALPTTIAAGAKLTVTLAFTPTTMGDATAQLSIGNDDPSTPSAILGLKGLGVSNVLNVTPASLDFGTLKSGTKSAPKTVTITNIGGDSIDLVDGALGGASASDYSVNSIAGALAPGQSTTASITFHPGAAGPSTAKLTIASSDSSIPTANVALTGGGISSLLALDATQLDFGHIIVGSKSDPKVVKVTNQSSAALTVGAVTSDNADFVVDAAALATLAPGESGTFNVTFAPSASGGAAGRIAVTLQGAQTAEIAAFASGSGDDVAPPSTDASSSGCGCKVSPSSSGGAGLAIAVAALALAAARRRASKRRR